MLCKKMEKENNENEIVLVLNEMPNTKIKEKIVKSMFYFNEDKDNKIIAEYLVQNNDIMEISDQNNIKPWEVVSLLVKYKIIVKRDEARGYEKYKETCVLTRAKEFKPGSHEEVEFNIYIDPDNYKETLKDIFYLFEFKKYSKKF
jgi:hypothetical protein